MLSLAGKIWLNGQLLPGNRGQVHLLTHCLHYGSGVFEGIRFYQTPQGSAIFRLKEHLDRLSYSARVIGIKLPFSKLELGRAINKTIIANKLKEGYVRPLVFYGTGAIAPDGVGAAMGVAILVLPRPSRTPRPIKAQISPLMRLHPQSVVVDAKVCGYYANSLLASLAAKKAGYDEAIFLDYRGEVAEATGRNVFMVKRGVINTPGPGTILPGITRDTIITLARELGLTVKEKRIKAAELLAADEVFLTGTATEITPVSQVDKRPFYKKTKVQPGLTTAKLQREYAELVRGRNPRFRRWLTPIS